MGGVDGMADNTCHFGINPMFCDNGLEGQQASPLYFPAEKFQADKMMEKIFWDPGLRFVFSLRSPVPQLLDEETTRKVGSTSFALVVEPLSSKTGLGSKYGFWLAKLGLPKLPIYDHIGINKGGEGGL